MDQLTISIAEGMSNNHRGNSVNRRIVLGSLRAGALMLGDAHATMVPLKYAINTHWHWDHTSGNKWIHQAGATNHRA